jgi:putative endonuclease
MPRHTDLGKKGEQLAADWLVRNGYEILHRNWRHGRYEVDIIAGRAGIIHILEVKCRRSGAYGRPEESVNRKKIGHILQGASGWLFQFPGHTRVQYDVLAITLRGNAEPEYFLLEDVYMY